MFEEIIYTQTHHGLHRTTHTGLTVSCWLRQLQCLRQWHLEVTC